MGKKLNATGQLNETEYHRVPEADLSREDIFEVLSNDRRRCTLHYLKRCDSDTAQLRDIVDFVAAVESDVPVGKAESNTRNCVYTALRQTHLPKLDSVGIVDYDKQRGTVTLTEAATEVQMYLEYVPGNDIPWAECYLGLTAVLAALGTAVWTGIVPFAAMSFASLTVLMLLVFGVSAVVHTYHTHRSRLGSESLSRYNPEEE